MRRGFAEAPAVRGAVRRHTMTAVLALVMAVGVGVATTTPAHAAVVTRYFQMTHAPHGYTWGHVYWESDYRVKIDAGVFNDSGTAVGVKFCWWHFGDDWWEVDGCGPVRYNYTAGTTKYFMGLRASQSHARIEAVTASLYVGSSSVDAVWTYVHIP